MEMECYIYIKDSPMKSIITLLVLLPTLAFSQVSIWRQTGGSVPASSQTSQSTQTRVQPSVPQQNNVSSWRNNPPQESQPLPPRGRGGFQNWNRNNQFGYYWGNWGWYQPMPYIWYDDYGWRQRSVIHVYESGKRDTIRKERVYTSFGFGHTTNKQAAFWGIVGGNKGYFIMDYVMTYAIDQNQYYPYGQINNVDFPLSKTDWKKESTFYVGAGKRIGKIGIHGMIGFGNEIIRWQGKDDLGGISFPKSNSTFTTFKVGIIKDFKFVTLKLETDPIRGYSQISIGLNNK
jgi:hypothetical protein